MPNRLELNLLPDPDNTSWLLRPEARYNGVSQLQMNVSNPNKVATILGNIKEVPIQEQEGQVSSLIQELLRDCDDNAIIMINKDWNIPNPKEFSFDLNLKSPIGTCYDQEAFTASTAEKLFNYYATLDHNSFTMQMLMFELPRIALGEKIDEFAFFV